MEALKKKLAQETREKSRSCSCIGNCAEKSGNGTDSCCLTEEPRKMGTEAGKENGREGRGVLSEKAGADQKGGRGSREGADSSECGSMGAGEGANEGAGKAENTGTGKGSSGSGSKCTCKAADKDDKVNGNMGESLIGNEAADRSAFKAANEEESGCETIGNGGAAKEAPGKKVIYLKGLRCADCAGKIEEGIKKISGVRAASLDFVAQRITIEAADKRKLPEILRRASEIISGVDPDIAVSYSDREIGKEENESAFVRRLLLALGAAAFVCGIALDLPRALEILLFCAAFLAAGGGIVLAAMKNILRGQIFDENFLMVIAGLGAFAIGEYPEGAAVMLFYRIGEELERFAVDRSRKKISSLMDMRPEYVNLLAGGEIRKTAPDEVAVGDIIVVGPAERIPLDGKVKEGRSSLDTSALTGESLPCDVEPGSEVLSGSVNKNALLKIEVTKEFSESAVSKILKLLENAGANKARTENFISKFARYYTPLVVLAALLLAVVPPLFIPGTAFSDWVYRALVFLVVSCPCALVISIPLSFFGGIGGASRNGILVKGSNYLEALCSVDTVLFDKTGTLTKGVFKVSKIEPAGGFKKDDLLYCAAYAESFSSHPIAVSIKEAYGADIDAEKISEYEEIPGRGVRARVDGKAILAGSAKLMEEEGIAYVPAAAAGNIVYIAVDGSFAGAITISDEIKPDSAKAVSGLRAAGVRFIAMLTGDGREAGEAVAKEIGLDAAYTELLPQQKYRLLEKLEREKKTEGKLAYVGDGINDAPSLARADIGIAMGGLGSDAAIEAADAVIMTDEPSKLVTAIAVAKKTRRIVIENIVFALGVKAVILALGALGFATMWEAVFADVGVAVIAIFNSIRALKA